jgi:hypothetical protein
MVKVIEERRISAALDTNLSDNDQQGEEMAVSLFQSYQRHVATWHKLKRQVNHQEGGGGGGGGGGDEEAAPPSFNVWLDK